MYSQNQMNTAAQLSQFVVENGRVQSDENGLSLESLRVEVEFECNERGLEDCAMIAEAAAVMASNQRREDYAAKLATKSAANIAKYGLVEAARRHFEGE